MARGQVEAFPRRYTDTVKIEPHITVGGLYRIVDGCREYGTATFNFESQSVTFTLEEEDDWNIREALTDIEAAFSNEGIPYVVDKTKMTRAHS